MSPRAPALRRALALALVAALVAGCATTSTVAPSVAPTPIPSVVASPSTPMPSPTADAFPDPVIRIVGPAEVVFDWSADRCADETIPDLPARAFRDAAGTVHQILPSPVNHRMSGPSLGELTVDCTPILVSTEDPDPAAFRDREWVGATWTADGSTVYALVHNEYQGHTHPGRCPQRDYFACWYNAITLAVSVDGGASFEHADGPVGALVASMPVRYEAGSGPIGLRAPSNIIDGRDGFLYAFVNLATANSADQWVCLLRTDDPADPSSWRSWNVRGFEGTFIDPYRTDVADPAAHECRPLDRGDIGHALNDSVTWNEALGRFVLLGVSADQVDGREVWGWYYAFSEDLVHWSPRRLLQEVPLPWTVARPGSDLSYLYPSLLDPASTSRNFDTTGATGFLYVTRNNRGHESLDRDLVRSPIRFFPTEADAAAAGF